MNYEKIKQRIIKELIEEILTIGSEEFELIGHSIIEMIENQKMIHHGLNKDYKPAGYTVDSFNQSGTIFGAYSTESGYFHEVQSRHGMPQFKKIEKDINGALEHCSGKIKKIYLFSSQEEPPSFRKKFNNSTASKNDRVSEILIYDAREIAKLIYEFSHNNSEAASFYCDFFPDFEHNFYNYEYYGKVPPICSNYFSEPAIIKAIEEHYENNHICILSGLSGAGKTQAAINFLHTHVQNFNNYIWISGEDWSKESSLASIKRTRGGTPINVSGLFNTEKTFLIIDNLNRIISQEDLKELSKGFTLKGKVLITSQLMNQNDSIYLSIPELSEEIAFKIIGKSQENATKKCKEFIEKCKFSPLILATSRDIAQENSIDSEELYTEILDRPVEIASRDGEAIMKKILSRLDNRYKQGLLKIANSGVYLHDSHFLNSYIGNNCCFVLQRIGILKDTNIPEMLRVHDLICKSIQEKENPEDIVSAINNYIGKFSGDMRPSVIREIHVCSHQLQTVNALRGEKNLDWITYALFQLNEANESLDSDVLKISSMKISEANSLSELLCIIDARELYAYTLPTNDIKKKFYNECACEYKASITDSTPSEIKRELLHHAGKAFRRCGMYEESFLCFTQLIEIEPKWHATLIQLAKLGIQGKISGKIKMSGKAALEKLFTYIFDEYQEVPLRVSLAAISLLRSYRDLLPKIIQSEEQIKKLFIIILMSGLDRLYQFYEAFYSFTSLFNYQYGEICLSLAQELPEMFNTSPDFIERRQWVNVCESLTNLANTAQEYCNQRLKECCIASACKFADAILEAQKCIPFTARAIAKTYIIGGMPEKALAIINEVPNDKLDHWLLYRKSEAELNIGNTNEALISAKKAFMMAKDDSKANDRISIYHELLAKCYVSLSKYDSAIQEYQLAIDTCLNYKYRDHLDLQLNNLIIKN